MLAGQFGAAVGLEESVTKRLRNQLARRLARIKMPKEVPVEATEQWRMFMEGSAVLKVHHLGCGHTLVEFDYGEDKPKLKDFK